MPTACVKELGRNCARPRTSTRRGALSAAFFGALIATVSAPFDAHASKTASLVIDANTGKVLHARQADASRFPASLTKIMTLYMVFDAIERGALSYDSKITASPRAAAQSPSKIGLKAGNVITVRQAVSALVTKSANDVATAVAEHLAGSEWAFARKMTARARAIGMRRTTFRNASGLPDSKQRTTARDMLTLALRMQDEFPSHYRNFRRRSFTWKGKRFRNHNTLLRTFNGTNGIKTGYTRASGFNLVSSVKRGRRHVVAAVFGGRTAKRRNATMRSLLNRTLKKASTRKTRRPWRRETAPMLVARPAPARPPRRIQRRTANPRLAAVRRVPFRETRAAPAPSDMANRWIDQIIPPRPRPADPPRSISELLARTTWSQDNATGTPRTAQVQIGAYLSEREARQRLDVVRRQSSDLLQSRRAVTQVVNRGAQRLYRARFAGFDAAAAHQTCLALKQRGVDCLVAE